jgi:NAD(P)-dependent dehydrogenase (short-subunit alcohol dehydrogenase family)
MIWFITGASRGFGREWAEAALARGDSVAATAREVAALEDLAGDVLTLQLDVTDRAACFAAIQRAAEHFDGLDVVVNNAGFGHFGMVEELSEADIRRSLETNFFGALWVTQAALPILRERRGHLVQVTSEGGVTAYPGIGAYHASKWALEGVTQSLFGEVEPLGVKVTLVEPAGFKTDWAASASRSPALDAYEDVRANGDWSDDLGDPRATRAAILALVDAERPPRRVFFGRSALGTVTRDYLQRLLTWNQWQPLAVEAHGTRG